MKTKADNASEAVGTASREHEAEHGDHLKAVAARTYRGHRSRRIGDEEILTLLPMVRKIARRAVSYIRPPLSLDDLVSAGTIGLLKAARDFDASHEAEFKTYAYIRIKGAVLDELRRASLLPSGVNKQIRQAQELSRKIAEETGTLPTDEELARRLSISVEDVYELFEIARAQRFVSIDGITDEQPALGAFLATDTAAPDDRLERTELLDELTGAMQQLDQRRLQVIVLYYHQQLTMKQIANLLDITESRVSQLHASALFSLSVKLEQWNDGGL